MTFREAYHSACCLKAKEVKRKLTSAEVFEVGVGCHDATQKAVKAQKREVSIASGAEQVYQLYPLHVGKEAALRAISVQLKKNELSYLLGKTNQFAEAVRSWPSSYRYFLDGGDRCPHPATWFTQGRYADDPQTWKRHGARNQAPHQYIPPKEPSGWRLGFPDFVDREKPWNQLQPAQHQFILKTLEATVFLTQSINEDTESVRLRTA